MKRSHQRSGYISNKIVSAILFLVLIVYTGKVQAQTYTKGGTVYEDYNGSKTLTAGEPGTNAGNLLCAYLLNSATNVVLQSQAVASNGTYSFTGLSALSGVNYVVAIGSCGIAPGTVFTGGSVSYNDYLVFPMGWSMSDPAARRWKTVGNGSNSTNNNFFIRKLSDASNVQSQILSCPSVGCVAIPGLSSTVSADNAAYVVNDYMFITVPAGGTLKAGNTIITAGKMITAAAAASLFYKNGRLCR